ncbi:MAG: PqqD family protein [Gemmatimonadaceae bacterium]
MPRAPGVIPLTLASRVAVPPDLMASDLAGEFVLLNLADGVYYGLDAVGAHIWRLLDQAPSVRAVVDDVVAQYHVDRVRCEDDVLTFLGDLCAHGLVVVVAADES